MLLEEYLPEFEFHERHEITVRAEPVALFGAIKELTPEEIPMLRTLFGIRYLPARLLGRGAPDTGGRASIFTRMLEHDFVLLGEMPEHEVAVGTIQQFWKLTGTSPVKVADGQEFRDFRRPDWGKAAMNFLVERVDPGPPGEPPSILLSTETRIHVPDPQVRRRFAAYWRVIFPGTTLLRRMWLGAIKARAERH